MNNQFDLAGRVVLITGGYGVLGGEIAAYLATTGAKVAILGRSREKVVEKCRQITDHGGVALPLIADVLDKSSLSKALEELTAEWGVIDILINAAGGNIAGATIMPDQTIFDLSLEDFSKVTQLNLEGTVLPSLVFGKPMADRGKGCILNISSMAAQQVLTRVVGYSAAKAAIENFTRWMAVEMALKYGENIRVNAIAPGFFIAEQNRSLLLNETGGFTERGQTIIQHTPMRRFGKSSELTGVVHWLCSSAASFVTGIVIPIDGGFSAFSGV